MMDACGRGRTFWLDGYFIESIGEVSATTHLKNILKTKESNIYFFNH